MGHNALTIFLIFFGVAVLDAIRGGAWQTIAFWVVVASVFAWLDRRGGWRAPTAKS